MRGQASGTPEGHPKMTLTAWENGWHEPHDIQQGTAKYSTAELHQIAGVNTKPAPNFNNH